MDVFNDDSFTQQGLILFFSIFIVLSAIISFVVAKFDTFEEGGIRYQTVGIALSVLMALLLSIIAVSIADVADVNMAITLSGIALTLAGSMGANRLGRRWR